MTRKELDKFICEKLFGMEPCRAWRPVWYKDMGAALVKNCPHPDDTCYSHVELVTILGRMGGPPQYCGSSRAGLILLRKLEKYADTVLVYWTKEGGWSAELRNRIWDTLERRFMPDDIVAGPSRAPIPEMAIALVAAELAGLKLTAEEVVD